MSEKIPNEENTELQNFKAEIVKLKKEEEMAGKTAHFDEVNPLELNEADRLIYQMLLDKKLTLKEFDLYRDEISRSGNKSQQQFAAYIANKLFIQMYKKD